MPKPHLLNVKSKHYTGRPQVAELQQHSLAEAGC